MGETIQTNISSAQKIYSIGEITQSIKDVLKSTKEFRNISVRGEISNFHAPQSSGHVYFTLKDNSASILPCAMFSREASKLKFTPKDGMRVIAKGDIDIYALRGNYQLIVHEVTGDGLGDLYKKFLLLKEKLEKEGLFAKEHKRKLPQYPKTIGAITSQTGAVFRDIRKIIKTQFPHLKILLFPTTVQGKEGTQSILDSIHIANSNNKAEVLILARGGGSLEDLWCFNEETVAYAIYNSKIPIISAIGHETDVTISDFVADVRAPTPSAAAQIVIQEWIKIVRNLDSIANSIISQVTRLIQIEAQNLDDISGKLGSSINNCMKHQTKDLNHLNDKLKSLNPPAVLKRGFSLTLIRGTPVLNQKQVKKGERLVSVLSQGKITSKVE